MGRSFTDKEATAFKKIYDQLLRIQKGEYSDRFLTQRRKKILELAGFSETEIRILTRPPHQPMEASKEIKIQIPKKTNEEQRLKAQGFNPAYTRGIDEANEWIAVGEQLREGKVDPYTSHIGYFLEKTMEHIQDIEKEIETPQQKRNLSRWKRYVEKKRRKNNFTYEDWLKVNWVLSKILNKQLPSSQSFFEYQLRRNFSESGRRLEDLESIEMLLYAFPRHIAIPTRVGDVGIIAFNKAGSHGMLAIGLKYGPFYFRHDLQHAVDATYPPLWLYEDISRLSEGLPIQKRKNIELAYWFLTHESSVDRDWFSSVRSMKKNLRVNIEIYDFLLPFDTLINGLVDTSSKENSLQHLKQVVKDFKKIFTLAKRKVLRY